jgi:hypothetical protein
MTVKEARNTKQACHRGESIEIVVAGTPLSLIRSADGWTQWVATSELRP